MTIPIILASSSERRKQLLSLIGVTVDQYVSPTVDETPLNDELPRQLALRLAQEKARAVAAEYPNHIIIAADNVVAVGRRILDKAETDDDVKRYLTLLSGRKNTVYTALSICHPSGKQSLKVVETKVTFKRLTASEIESYIQTGEGIGKAGGYAIQGIASKYIKTIQGSYHAVMGLPVHEVYQVLSGWGNIN
ncbi:Maf family protein [Candidatus Bodocaedibacter vickermanii]|uniref:Nucleoside triphosphate pyrophosphatase n=1 Tax=Candidatus Bodocaedibacter vickermanii TaxID=2741701 RepID=A0A7L9RSW7_9PROT|nr:Septum formation protein Maf [Candidatus Paracaedibacteraceae bacterium 'Lake Konstanz']